MVPWVAGVWPIRHIQRVDWPLAQLLCPVVTGVNYIAAALYNLIEAE